MKNQALFSSKDKSKKLKCRLLQVLFVALKVKIYFYYHASLYMNNNDTNQQCVSELLVFDIHGRLCRND